MRPGVHLLQHLIEIWAGHPEFFCGMYYDFDGSLAS